MLWPIVICTKYESNEKIVKIHQAACGTQIGLDCGKPAPLAHRNSGSLQKWHALLHAFVLHLNTNSSNALPDVKRLQQNLSKLNLLILDLKGLRVARQNQRTSPSRGACVAAAVQHLQISKLFQWYILPFWKTVQMLVALKKIVIIKHWQIEEILGTQIIDLCRSSKFSNEEDPVSSLRFEFRDDWTHIFTGSYASAKRDCWISYSWNCNRKYNWPCVLEFCTSCFRCSHVCLLQHLRSLTTWEASTAMKLRQICRLGIGMNSAWESLWEAVQ